MRRHEIEEHTGEIEGTTVVYYLGELLETMKQTLRLAKQADKDAAIADWYAQQVDLEYDLTHKLQDIQRLANEIQELNEEKEVQLSQVEELIQESKDGFLKSFLMDHATVDDIETARQDYEAARSEEQAAETQVHELEEKLARAKDKLAKCQDTAKRYREHYETTKAAYAQRKGAPDKTDAFQRSRAEFRRAQVRYEVQKADIEKEFAQQILKKRQEQNSIAAEAKKKVEEAEKTFSKAAVADKTGAGTNGSTSRPPALPAKAN